MKDLNIILVDDDVSILESVKIVLESEGYNVFSAVNGKDLDVLMSTLTPHLLLLDYALPGETGAELTKKVRNNPDTANLPVIIISANANFRSPSKLAGANDFIEKPFEINYLLSKVRKLISLRN